MNDDEIKGKARNVKGRVKDAAGSLTGNRRLESEGEVDRGAGAAQEKLGEARRKVGEAIEDLGDKIRK
jgi:uncharacterized protein YjbJ (UPF0337 family)